MASERLAELEHTGGMRRGMAQDFTDRFAAAVLPLAQLPDWLNETLVIAAVALAFLAVALMFRRVDASSSRPAGDDPVGLPERQYPSVYYDPVLIVSALGIVALAVAAWVLR